MAKVYRLVSVVLILLFFLWFWYKLSYANQFNTYKNIDYYFAILIMIMVLLFVISLFAKFFIFFKNSKNNPYLFLAWLLVILIIASIYIQFDGYKMTVIGLNAITSNLQFTAQKSLSLLFNYYDFHPTQPLYAFILSSAYHDDLSYIYSAVWDKNSIMIVLIVNLIVSFLSIFKGRGFRLLSYLLLAIVLVTILSFLDMTHPSDKLNIQLIASIEIIVAITLLYSTLKIKGFKNQEKKLQISKERLPPSGLFMIFIIFIGAPVVADVSNQLSLMSKVQDIKNDIEKAHIGRYAKLKAENERRIYLKRQEAIRQTKLKKEIEKQRKQERQKIIDEFNAL